MKYAKFKLVSQRLAYLIAIFILIGIGYYLIIVRPIKETNKRICSSSSIEVAVEENKKIILKPACTSREITTGYQNALVQPLLTGKIFVLGRPSIQWFWMKNVPFHLGLVYLNKDFQVLSTHVLKPYDENPVWSRPTTAYALEINPEYLANFPVGKTVFTQAQFN